jgi:hypothetical protein
MNRFLVTAAPDYPADAYRMTGAPRTVDVYLPTSRGAVRIATERPVGNRLEVTIY